jgi:ferredoxin-type protein NapH
MRKYLFPIGMWLVFEAIAITLWLTTGTIFYFFNFTYIGSCIAIGILLYIKSFPYARQVVQFAVGLYMLVYLGILSRENMQIAGFWYYLFLGVFQAAVIHYAVAKLFGPLLFGRGWCGYACWTAMVLDLLPYKKPNAPRKRIGWIRYLVFAGSLAFVGVLFLFHIPKLDDILFWSFIIGNAVYYIVGIALAFAFRDNRAFCKYICPITVFLKPASYYSLARVRVDLDKCVSCGKCRKVCPMNVDMINNARSRTNGTECILCNACVDVCPKGALKL